MCPLFDADKNRKKKACEYGEKNGVFKIFTPNLRRTSSCSEKEVAMFHLPDLINKKSNMEKSTPHFPSLRAISSLKKSFC